MTTTTTTTTTTTAPSLGAADGHTRQLLDSHGVGYVEALVSVAEIDWQASEAAQVRNRQLDDETLDRYVAGVEAGVEFPAIVTTPTPDGRVKVLAGMHRAGAVRLVDPAGGKLRALHCSSLDARTELLVSVGDNAFHGLPLTDAERARAAARLMDEHGLTARAAAEAVGVSSPQMVSRHATIRQSNTTAGRLGIERHWRRLPDSGKWRLFTVIRGLDDVVLCELAVAAGETAATSADCYQLAADIAACRRHTTAAGGNETQAVLDLIEEWEADRAVVSPAARASHGPGAYRTVLARVLDFDPAVLAGVVRARDRQATRDMCAAAALRIAEIAVKLEAAL